MTDQTVVEGNPTVPQEPGNATPPVSAPTPGQPSQVDLAAQVRELQAVVRSLQSGKDKGNAQLRKELAPLVEIARHLGVEPEKVKEAQRNILLDRLYEQEFGERNQTETAPGTSAPETAVEATTVIKQAGLNESDPNVLAIVAKGLTGVNLAVELGKYAARVAAAPNPTPAQSPAPVSPVAPQQSKEELKREYIEVMRKNRGNPKALAQYRVQYANKGLDVFNVDFT